MATLREVPLFDLNGTSLYHPSKVLWQGLHDRTGACLESRNVQIPKSLYVLREMEKGSVNSTAEDRLRR